MMEKEYGREPLQIIEIVQPKCSLTYGVAPCTADLGVTGDNKCFNTSKTCQDTANYDSSETISLFFCRADHLPPVDMRVIPSVRSVSTSPTEINVVGGDESKGPLGVRAKITASFTDHPDSDFGVDPYLSERGYIATDRGTFWTKWLARNPYYNNYTMRIYDGYAGQALNEMNSRTYFIDSINGPDSRGGVRVIAKDVLKLADNDRAQAPAASQGELIVDYGETTAITSLRVTRATASEYPAPGTVRVNDEVMTYTGVTTVSSTEIRLAGITRATDGTEKEDHDAGDRVQLCLRYTETRADVIAKDLLTNYGDVPLSLIPTAEWAAEASVWLAQFRLSTLITEPTGVTDLLGEITEQALFFIWWDERAQLIRLKALRPSHTDPIYDIDSRNNIIAGSVGLKSAPRERVSQVWVFFQQRNPTENLSEEKNYRRIRVRIDGDAESDLQYGEPRIKKVYSRWIQTDAVAIQTNARLLARFRDTPQYFTFQLDAKDREIWSGDVVEATVDNIVDPTGLPKSRRWQVISAEETMPGEVVQYKAQFYEFQFLTRSAVWMRADAPSYTNAPEEDKILGAYWGTKVGDMPDGSPGYSWQ